MSFLLVESGVRSSPESSSSSIPIPEDQNEVSYYHPAGCDGVDTEHCDDEKIKRICWNNEKGDDEDEGDATKL